MEGLYEELRLALHHVWRKRWIALAIAWAVCVLGWLAVSLIPNKYQSQARIFVEMQSLLPGKIGITDRDRQKDIERVQQTLTSVVNLEKIVRATDLGLRAGSDKEVTAMATDLGKKIKVSADQDNLFALSAEMSGGGFSDAENAKLAKAVVQKLVDIFVEENLAGNRDENRQTPRFLDQEIASREKQLQESEQRRVEFEQKYMGLLPGVGSVSQRMAAARVELQQVEGDLISAQSAANAMQGQLSGTPASISTPGAMVGGGGANSARLAQLQSQLAEAQANGWTDSHPDVVALRSQIARIRPLASGEGGARSSSFSTPNPSYMALRSMVAEKQANAAALQSRKNQLQATLQEMENKQVEEPGVMAEQQRLNRDYDVLKAQYDKLLGDREDVRLRTDVANKTDAVKFRIIDPPSAPSLPSSPNRPILLVGVLLMGVGAGVGGAFVLSQLQSTYSTAKKLAEATGLPVLGSVSYAISGKQRADSRHKLKLFAGISAALVGCCVLLILVELIKRSLVA